MLADEPTGALDSRSGDTIIELLHELHREGTAITVITHDSGIARAFDRQVELLDGQIRSDSAAVAA